MSQLYSEIKDRALGILRQETFTSRDDLTEAAVEVAIDAVGRLPLDALVTLFDDSGADIMDLVNEYNDADGLGYAIVQAVIDQLSYDLLDELTEDWEAEVKHHEQVLGRTRR